MEEIWADVKGYEGRYKISNLGRVKSIGRFSIQNHWIPEKILKQHKSQGGYLETSLYIDGKRTHKKIHRMVAEAFIPNPNNLPEVDHIDTDKNNNCVSNLRWVTHQENHMNPNTIEYKRKNWPKNRVNVYRDGKLIYQFYSLMDMNRRSKDIFGITLWGIYAMQVINGERSDYHGYTFKLESCQ